MKTVIASALAMLAANSIAQSNFKIINMHLHKTKKASATSSTVLFGYANKNKLSCAQNKRAAIKARNRKQNRKAHR